jgi:hypothetical protein
MLHHTAKPFNLNINLSFKSMKKYVNYFSCLILLLLICSCNKERKDFELSKQTNTVQALKDFLTKYPDGDYVDSANYIVDKLNWQDVISKNTIADYESFMSQYPESKFIDSAKIALDTQYPIRNIVAAKDSGMVNVNLISTNKETSINVRVTNNLQKALRIKIPSGKTVLAVMQFGELAITSAADTILNLNANDTIEKIFVQSGEAKITKGNVKLSRELITMEANTSLMISIGM